jgi:uncharacterized membrane protein YgcG
MADEEDFEDVERASVEDLEGGVGSGGGAEVELVEAEEVAGELVEAEEHVEEGPAVEAAADSGGEQGDGSMAAHSSDFRELHLPEEQIVGTQEAWKLMMNAAASREAMADAIYGALYESMPSLQSLFVTPRAVLAMRMFAFLNALVNQLANPKELKLTVETLCFGHLDKDVTIPRAIIFRDSIVDLFVMELGSKLSSAGAAGLVSVLNWIAGSIMYVKATYTERVACLTSSWAIANDTGGESADKFERQTSGEDEKEHTKGSKTEDEDGEETVKSNKKSDSMVQNVPTTFKEMFQFNAAVMGYGSSLWMNEVLAQFENIIVNVHNAGRMQEECYVICLRIAKVTNAKINLGEFKSCMLASLRSLLPKDWTTSHEVAWTWLWETVENLVMQNMGKTQIWDTQLTKFLDGIDEAAGYEWRQDVYVRFFAVSPVGEGYFKQSNTYLHLIATKVVSMTAMIFKDPVYSVNDISGVGLRHVGYAIPTELFGPWCQVFVDSVEARTDSEDVIEAVRWGLGLVARMQCRTILEGSTIVMKAINGNSKKALEKAISCAPRGERAAWMLIITVGTQDISPFLWSIQSGSLDAGLAMLKDLLTIRADRDKYYYAAEDLFRRHPDIVKVLLDDAPGLLPDLMDGLVWRSRITVNGYRRVNYYLKDLLYDADEKFHPTLEWVAQANDPSVVCHPILILLADLVWNRVACRTFLYRKSWGIATLGVFILSQSVIKSMAGGEEMSEGLRFATVVFRGFIYLFSMAEMIFTHSGRFVGSFRQGKIAYIGMFPVPSYLVDNWQESFKVLLMLCLIVMLTTEPILHCINDDAGKMFNDTCAASDKIRIFPYSVFTMISMFLYFLLLIDLVVLSNRVSAYILVCGRMLAELALFLLAEALVLLTLSSAFSCLEQKQAEFKSIPSGFMALWKMIVSMYSTDDYEELHNEPVVLIGVYGYLILSSVFLMNLLIAQLSCAYDAIYADMVGFARLKRIKIVVDAMRSVSDKRWGRFIEYLELDTRIEFNEGDVGLAGGVQVLEAAGANPTTVDTIKRFGGSTNATIQWPEEEDQNDDSDRFQRIEDLIKKMGEATSSGKTGHKKHKAKGASSSGMSGGGGSGAGASGDIGNSGASGSGIEDEEEDE